MLRSTHECCRSLNPNSKVGSRRSSRITGLEARLTQMPEEQNGAGPGVGAQRAAGLSKLLTSSSAHRGSAALPCGKPPAFRPVPEPPPSSAQAGRPSLPACAEEVFQDTRPTERRSLSANQAAEPQAVAHPIEGNLDKPGASSGPTNSGVGGWKRTAGRKRMLQLPSGLWLMQPNPLPGLSS